MSLEEAPLPLTGLLLFRLSLNRQAEQGERGLLGPVAHNLLQIVYAAGGLF
jgi:hypothetical protein